MDITVFVRKTARGDPKVNTIVLVIEVHLVQHVVAFIISIGKEQVVLEAVHAADALAFVVREVDP